VQLRGGVRISDFAMTLSQIGFVEGEVVETILSTLSKQEQPNAAPMGVWVGKESRLFIRPYQETQTALNLENNPDAVINLTQDPELFLAMAFKQELSDVEAVVFEPSKVVNAPRIRGVDGVLEVTVTSEKKGESMHPFKEFLCEVKHIDFLTQTPLAYSRSRSAAIESVIHATKIRALYKNDQHRAKGIALQIDQLHELVERIAPKSPSAEVIRRIRSLLPKWIK
jgi:hypothetical protein